MTVIGVPTGPLFGEIVTVRNKSKEPLATPTPPATAQMSWLPPKSVGAVALRLKSPLASDVTVARFTYIELLLLRREVANVGE